MVNETAAAARRALTIEGVRYEVPVAAGGSRLALFERQTGRLLAATAGAAIEETGAAETGRATVPRRPCAPA